MSMSPVQHRAFSFSRHNFSSAIFPDECPLQAWINYLRMSLRLRTPKTTVVFVADQSAVDVVTSGRRERHIDVEGLAGHESGRLASRAEIRSAVVRIAWA